MSKIKDFNDMACLGLGSIKEAIDAAMKLPKPVAMPDTAATKEINNKTKLIHGIQPHYTQEKVFTPDEASGELFHRCKEYFENPKNMGIGASAGVGKTINVLIALNVMGACFDEKGNTLKTEIYLPRYDLADEILIKSKHVPHKKSKLWWQPKGVPSYLNAVIIHGRGFLDEEGEPLCQKNKVAEELSRSGLPVYSNLCRRFLKKGEIKNHKIKYKCEYHDACPYIQQFQEKDYHIRIYTHAHLGVDRSFLDNDVPDFAVIDESYYKTLLVHVSIAIGKIASSGWSEEFINALFKGLVTKAPLLKHLRDTLGKNGVYEALDEAEQIAEKAASLYLFDLSEDDQLEAAKKIGTPTRQAEFLRVLRAELNTGRDIAHGIEYGAEGNGFELHYRKTITRFTDFKKGKKCSVLAIDADFNEGIHDQFFPNIVHHKIHVDRNCRVTQVYSTALSKACLFGQKEYSEKRHVEIQTLIDRVTKCGKKVLVVGSQGLTGNPAKKIPAKVNTPHPDGLAHFNCIRGMDNFKDHDAVIVAGRNQPPPQGVERVARALYFDSDTPLNLTGTFVSEPRGYRIRGGIPLGVDVQVHTDPRIQQLHEQIRESESQQAIDRLRLIHSQKDRHVYLLSNLVLDVPVDNIISWTDLMAGGTRLEKAWWLSDGVLPLSPDFLMDKFAGVFLTEAITRRELKQLAKMCDFPYILFIRKPTHLIGGFKFEVQQLMVAWCSAFPPRIILHAAIFPPALCVVGG